MEPTEAKPTGAADVSASGHSHRNQNLNAASHKRATQTHRRNNVWQFTKPQPPQSHNKTLLHTQRLN
jgi:hypothetical protein